VKVAVVSTQGKEGVVAILGRHQFVGEGCAAVQTRRTSTAVALTECVVLRLERAAFLRAMRDEPAFSQSFMTYLLSRSIRAEADLADHLFHSSEKRLARLLLQLADLGTEESGEAVIVGVSQETLAEMIGTTRPRVSFFMTKFRKAGFIDYKDGIEVRSSLASVVLAE
jgi:CRP-like cAMP-binding protein